MAHRDRSIRERVIALRENGNMSITQAAAIYGVPRATAYTWWRKYLETGSLERKVGTGLVKVSTPEQDQALVDTCRQNPFMASRQLQITTQFPGSCRTVRRRLRAEGLHARRAAIKEDLTENHKVDRLAFAEANIDRVWNRVIFTDEKVFSSSNDGPRLVYRPEGTRYDPQYVVNSHRMGHVTVNCWGWLCRDTIGELHRIEGRLNSQKYLDIMRYVMLPAVRNVFDDGIVEIQQDHSAVHDSHLVQTWFAEEPNVELVDWVPRASDLNPIENLWAEVTRTLQENWPDPPPRRSDDLWELVLNAWEDIAQGQRFVAALVDSMPRRLQAVINANGGHTRY